jgi:hypothetical protein
VVAIEAALGELTAGIARDTHHVGDEESLLHELTRLAAEVEQGLSTSQYRFGACRAYSQLVATRIAELRERRLPGLQTVDEFMARRFSPAVATCNTVSQRLHDLSERVSQASSLLATRVGIARERQNQDLLASMDRRAKLQLHLQQTVEGLSVAAIAYYAAGLVGYLAKAAKAAGLPIDPDVVVGLAVPLLAGAVFLAVRRARHVRCRAAQPLNHGHGSTSGRRGGRRGITNRSPGFWLGHCCCLASTPRSLKSARLAVRGYRPMSATLKDLLAQGAADAPAISAPGRPALSHGALRALIERTLATLNGLGIGRNDRVAIVLPNGPEMATCYMACASGVTSAPLNPAYRADEFEFYLSDLNAKALIVEQGSTSPAIDVARKLGVRLIDWCPTPAPGRRSFTLSRRDGAGGTASPTGGYAQPTMCRWCCTPRAPPRGPRSCRCRRATWRRRPPTSATRCSSRPPTAG